MKAKWPVLLMVRKMASQVINDSSILSRVTKKSIFSLVEEIILHLAGMAAGPF